MRRLNKITRKLRPGDVVLEVGTVDSVHLYEDGIEVFLTNDDKLHDDGERIPYTDDYAWGIDRP